MGLASPLDVILGGTAHFAVQMLRVLVHLFAALRLNITGTS